MYCIPLGIVVNDCCLSSYQVGSCQQQAANAEVFHNIPKIMELKSFLDKHEKVSRI